MHRLFALLALLASGFLAACSVTVDTGLPAGVAITDASYKTNHQATIDGQERNVICDDRTTVLEYSFRFSGNLQAWESYLRGVKTGEIKGRKTFDLNSSFVDYDPSSDRVTVRYEIAAGQAPQAIVPTPVVEGHSKLFLNFAGATRGYELLSRDIPVLANCG